MTILFRTLPKNREVILDVTFPFSVECKFVRDGRPDSLIVEIQMVYPYEFNQLNNVLEQFEYILQ